MECIFRLLCAVWTGETEKTGDLFGDESFPWIVVSRVKSGIFGFAEQRFYDDEKDRESNLWRAEKTRWKYRIKKRKQNGGVKSL